MEDDASVIIIDRIFSTIIFSQETPSAQGVSFYLLRLLITVSRTIESYYFLGWVRGPNKAFINRKQLAYITDIGDDTTSIPSGVICMWSGNTSNIPTGWALCNGSNGTPDLRNRFIVGAGSTYSPRNTGGSKTVSLTSANLPSHNHSFSVNGTTGSGGSSNPSVKIDLSDAYFGVYDNASSTGGGSGGTTLMLWAREGMNAYSSSGISGSKVVISGGSGNSGSVSIPSHTHSFNYSGNTTSAGSGTAHENMPPYYALCFIMKL